MSVGGSVEKPRFFIDLLNYQYNIGNVGTVATHNWHNGEMHPYVLGLSPTKPFESVALDNAGDTIYFRIGFKYPISLPSKNMFLAILGHNFASKEYGFDMYFEYLSTTPNGEAWKNPTASNTQNYHYEIVNGEGVVRVVHPSYDGWSLGRFDPDIIDDISGIVVRVKNVSLGHSFKIGGIAIGMIYEPEFHADLAVTQSRIMDGIKNKQTKGGHTYSVINYTKPPNWWNGSPFELTPPSSSQVAYSNARIGRRSWNVGFSQLSDRFYTDGLPNGVFPANDMVNNYLGDAVNGGYLDEDLYVPDGSGVGEFNYNINTDNSLYSTVYHHSLGGTLPYLFSPSQDNSPQNFAICRFDKPGFKVTQKSHKKFNIKMKINESW